MVQLTQGERFKLTWMVCIGAWLAVIVRVVALPGEIVVPADIWSEGTLLFMMLVSADDGDPTV